MTPTVAQTNARAADLLVAGLVDAGVRAAVASPGSRNTPLVLALAARPDLALHVVLDERVAGFLALGLARASGRPVALACTSGSAGAHYLPALIEARYSRVPLVAITADRPPELHGCGAPQTIDQRELFGRHARESRALMPPDDARDLRPLRATAAELVHAAVRIPAAPVHLDAAFREPLWAPGVAADPLPADPKHPETAPVPAPPAALVDRLRAARRGVVVAGPDARDAAPLARALGWPLLAEPAADAGRSSAADALLRGPFARSRPDRALHLGLAPTSKALRQWLAGVELYTVDPAGQNRSGDPDARVVTTDAAALAAAFEAPPGDPAWRARWQAAEETARSILDAHAQTGALWSGAIAHHLAAAALRHRAALHAGNSMAIRDLDFAAALPTPLYTSRGANGIDGTLATAAGEGIALDRPIAVVLGDLSALHDVGGLLHAGQTGHPLTAVIVDNGGGGIFEYLAIAEHPERFERLFATPQPARFEALTAAAGGRYHRVDAAAALDAALDTALPRAGLDVVHCVIDRKGDTARHRAAWAAVAAATEAM